MSYSNKKKISNKKLTTLKSRESVIDYFSDNYKKKITHKYNTNYKCKY